ncbi:MAG: minor capsid protein [Gammaproteobacteria bacterium]|nr:minor capsid protein [Gammaproteobacteria bacterium]
MPLKDDLNNVIDPILAAFHDQIKMSINAHLVRAYLQADAQVISWGKTKLRGLPILYEGPPVQQAIDWATKHGAKLVTQMDEDTKSRLAQVISDGIKNKRGIPGLARDIRKDFDDMSKYRSRLIAQTETNSALSQASETRMKDIGVTGKEWIVIGDERTCEICLGNEAQGAISINQKFKSGHDAPPGHPGCRCALAPVMLPE